LSYKKPEGKALFGRIRSKNNHRNEIDLEEIG
jgi:hypothetical protein